MNSIRMRRPKNAPVCLHKGAEIEKLCPCGGYKPDANYRYQRRQLNRAHKLRGMGKPMNVTKAEYARARALIVEAHDVYGMSHRDIGLVVGCHWTWPVKIYSGETNTMRRVKYEAILRTLPAKGWVPKRTKAPAGARTQAVGTQRRVRALLADGFTCKFLGEHMGWTLAAVSKYAHETKAFVFSSTHAEFAELYAKLAGTNPTDYGINAQAVKQMSTLARKYGWAGTSCWDEDTIDDPETVAEWTGQCGTVYGFRIHYRDKILPVCKECHTARTVQRLWPRLGELMGVAAAPNAPGRAMPEDDVAGIVAALASGELSTKAIAGDFGVSTKTVVRIRKEMDL